MVFTRWKRNSENFIFQGLPSTCFWLLCLSFFT